MRARPPGLPPGETAAPRLIGAGLRAPALLGLTTALARAGHAFGDGAFLDQLVQVGRSFLLITFRLPGQGILGGAGEIGRVAVSVGFKPDAGTEYR